MKKPGRPLEFGTRLNEILQVNVTTAEREQIEKWAIEKERSISGYIRSMIFDPKLKQGR